MSDDTHTIENFFAQAKQITYKKNEIILRPDDVPSGVYFIEKGYVKVYSITEDGEEKLHIIYKPGELFPLIWVLQGTLKNVYYEAMDTLTVRRCSKEKFLQFIKEDADVIYQLLSNLVNVFNVFADRIDNLEIPKAYPRTVARILSIAERFGVKSGNQIVIQVPITQKDIANSITMTRETASREIERLEKKNLISYKNHHVVINDVGKLREELLKYHSRGSL